MTQTALVTHVNADPWARCISLYLQSIKERSAKTYDSYVYTLRAFFTMFRGKPPDYITREDVERFVRTPARFGRNKDKPPAASTLNTRRAILSSFYKFASQFTYTGEDGRPVRLFSGVPPTAGTKQIKTPRPRRVLTQDELERLFAAMPKNTVQGLRDRSLFTFFLLTGRRLNEVRGLCYGDITWDVISEPDGSSRMGWVYRWIGEKGQHGEEKVSELPVICKVLIDEWLEASGRLPLESDDPIWIGIERPGMPLDPFKPLSKGAITRALRKYAVAAGIDKPVSTHWLRHASAKARYEKDKDVIKIMKALGHSDLQSTYVYLQNFLGTSDAGARELAHTFTFLLK